MKLANGGHQERDTKSETANGHLIAIPTAIGPYNNAAAILIVILNRDTGSITNSNINSILPKNNETAIVPPFWAVSGSKDG